MHGLRGQGGRCGWVVGRFQVLVDNDELRAALGAIRSALTEDGRFMFETRNPAARAWEAWVPANAVEVARPDGSVLRMVPRVEPPVDGELVSFVTTYELPGRETSRSTLRFLGPDALSRFLAEVGLDVVERFGDWDASPFTPASPEIIVAAGPRDGTGSP